MTMAQASARGAARLLVVDDDEAARTFLAVVFGRHGMDVEVVGDGRTAVQRLRAGRYDVLILDLMLPDPNGFEILREVRSFNQPLLGRTIVLTALSRRTLDDFGDGASVYAVMYKPFELDDLVETVLSAASLANAAQLSVSENAFSRAFSGG